MIGPSNDVSRPGLDRFMDLMAPFADAHMRPDVRRGPAVKSVRPRRIGGRGREGKAPPAWGRGRSWAQRRG